MNSAQFERQLREVLARQKIECFSKSDSSAPAKLLNDDFGCCLIVVVETAEFFFDLFAQCLENVEIHIRLSKVAQTFSTNARKPDERTQTRCLLTTIDATRSGCFVDHNLAEAGALRF